MSARILVVICVTLVLTECAKLPSFFTKCKKDDPEVGKCIVKNANDGIKEFSKGHPSHHIQSLLPLEVPFIHIDVNGGLILNLTNVKATGLENAVFKDVKVDFEKKHFTIKFSSPKATLIADYDINGRILILPITGQGLANITFVNPGVVYEFDYDLKEKGKHTYMELKNSKLVYKPDRAYFKLDNLFNGDKRLGEEMNKFLDESWEPVNEEIGEKAGEGIGQVITKVIGDMFSKVPFEECFD